jgi:hypothetical protein
MNKTNFWFAVFLIRTVGEGLFEGDLTRSYQVLKSSGFLKYAMDHFDVLHTQSSDYLVESVDKWLKEKV